MPDYFTALVSQYTGALNTAQSERYAKAVIDAWYFSLPINHQKVLLKLLPDYLRPKHNLFFARLRQKSYKSNTLQSEVFYTRLVSELSRASIDEVVPIASGVLKSLKILSSHQKKFEYSKLFSNKLVKLYIDA